jgi:hypothetical protein
MAGRAGVRHFQRVCFSRRDELERVAADVHIRNGLLDLRHMAIHALAARRTRLVMRMRFDRHRSRTIRRIRVMAFETQHIRGLQQIGIVFGAMHVMATEAAHPMRIHRALHEIIALHPVLVRGAIGEMRECRLAQLVLFQLPEVLQLATYVETHRPVIVFPLNRIVQRLSLRMALDTGIVRLNGIEAGRIDNVAAGWASHMIASRAMASLASHIPFGDGLGFDVVVDGMTPVAKRTRWPFHVVGGIQRRPPVRSILDEVWPPHLVSNIPLRRQDIIIVADLFEIPLLPLAAVYEGDVFLFKSDQRIRLREVRKDRFRVFFRIYDNIRHPGLLPALINLRMARFARARPYVMGVSRRACN